MPIAAVTKLPSYPSIADVYFSLAGSRLENIASEECLGHCLSTSHSDTNPSCHYNTIKNLYQCKSCGEGGDIFSLVIVAGKAETRKDVFKYFKEKRLLPEHYEQTTWLDVDAIYQYRDAEGALLYEVGRWKMKDDGKTFRQRVPDGKGGYNEGKKSLTGIVRVPYRLPELLAHAKTSPEIPVFVVEGEKDVDNLVKIDAIATTNSQGTDFAWPIKWAEYFKGLNTVYVLADNDDVGKKAATQRAKLLATVVPNVKLLVALPDVGEKEDVSNWLENAESTLQKLYDVCENAETVAPYVPSYDINALPLILNDKSDIGIGRWFNYHYSATARFVYEERLWYIYTDGAWSKNGYKIEALMQTSMDSLLDAANDYSGEDSDELKKFAIDSRSLVKRKATLETARSNNLYSITEFDTQQHLFNCPNGTLNLNQHKIQSHTSTDYITLKSKVYYDANATCPKFIAWLNNCVENDKELFKYLQMVIGSCLEGRAGLRSFYFIFGPKGTGKSTFIRILQELLGPYQCSADFDSLTESKYGNDGGAPTPHLARLKGCRMVSASEAKGNAKLDSARIKQLIGGDMITARYLNHDPFEFRFEATLLMSGNEMPRIVGDASIWDKFKPVPFLNEIGDNEDPYFLDNALIPELSGILNFALEGLKQYRETGYRMNEPVKVLNARLQEFDAQDSFKDFIYDCVIKFDPSTKHPDIPTKVMRETYTAWAKKNAQPLLDARILKSSLERHRIKNRQVHGGLVWMNIGLKFDGEAPKSQF